MILIFLGSWRSMVVVSTSIPLSILAAIICLNLAGDSINIMTLGGLALAIGMLVDDATVAVENIHRNRALGKPLTIAVVDGSRRSPCRPSCPPSPSAWSSFPSCCSTARQSISLPPSPWPW